ncbi:MAG: HAMP domain-containing protein, partial [Comamonadaceae bacterium]
MGDSSATPPAAARVPAAEPLRRRLSLAQQLVLLAVLPAVLAMLGGIGVLTRQYLDGVSELVRANARTVALQLATAAQSPLTQMDRRALMRLAQGGLHQSHVQQVQLWSEDGEIVANAETVDRRRADGVRELVPVMDEAGQPVGQVMVEMSLDAVQSARRTVWFNVLLVLGASLLGVVLAGTWAARRISAPIRRLGEAVDRLGAGEEVHVPLEGAAEVRHLQAGFNEASRALAESQRLLQSRIDAATAELAHKNQQLEVASQAKTRLLAAASHDLRQPLHALTLFSDGLAHGETDPVRLTRIGHIQE